MAQAIYCDKCKKLFNCQDIKLVVIKLSYPNEPEHNMDLCSNCHDELESFIYDEDKKSSHSKLKQCEGKK